MATVGDWKDVLNGSDAATARLIVRMQLEDMRALAPDVPRAPKRMRRDNDTDVASQLYLEELRACEADMPGRVLGEDLEEDENANQHALEAAAFGWHYDEYRNAIERAPESVQPVTCTVCTDSFRPDRVARVPCGHHYCPDCLEQLYNMCMTDETLFPPRCCHQEFPWEHVRHFLTQRLKSLFGQKRLELETKDRTYCFVPTCSAFIRPYTYNAHGAPCPNGHGWTCVKCKQAYHQGACLADRAEQALLNTAHANQWKQCFGCRRMVELKTGCNHITCVCRTEFCYVCGLQWKTCNCVQWDEARLLERAEGVVNNQRAPALAPNGAPPNHQPERAVQVAEAAEHLRQHHECEHARWQKVDHGDLVCEECGDEMTRYVFRCRQCDLQACMRCRFNRV